MSSSNNSTNDANGESPPSPIIPESMSDNQDEEEPNETSRRPNGPPNALGDVVSVFSNVVVLPSSTSATVRATAQGLNGRHVYTMDDNGITAVDNDGTRFFLLRLTQSEENGGGERPVLVPAGEDIPLPVLRAMVPMIQAHMQAMIDEDNDDVFAAAVGSPPASAHTLQTLAESTLTARDLLVPANRDCSICLGDYTVHDRVVRLPCAHRFCLECIRNWLTERCTCPDCRYELPTDNAAYEPGRLERMALRPPRFARYELFRLFTEQLYELAGASDPRNQNAGRETLVGRIIESGNIALIPEEEEEAAAAATATDPPTSAIMSCYQPLPATVSMDSSESTDADETEVENLNPLGLAPAI